MDPKVHPFENLKPYLYMEAGTPNLPIYMFKFGNEGILIELHLNDKINGPSCRFYKIAFSDEYNFELVSSYKDISRDTTDQLYETINKILESEVKARYGTSESRENS